MIAFSNKAGLVSGNKAIRVASDAKDPFISNKVPTRNQWNKIPLVIESRARYSSCNFYKEFLTV